MILLTFITFTQTHAASLDSILADLSTNTYFEITNSSVEVLSQRDKSKTIDLILLLDVDSLWAQDEVLNKELEKVNKSLSSCSLTIGTIYKIKIKVSEKMITQLNYSNPYEGPSEKKIAKEGVPSELVTAFLIRKYTRRGHAHAYNLESIINSRRFGEGYGPLLNTTWVSEDNLDPFSAPNALESYSTLSHELAHIIGNMGHIIASGPNLMPLNPEEGFPHSHELNSDQCQKILNFEHVIAKE